MSEAVAAAGARAGCASMPAAARLIALLLPLALLGGALGSQYFGGLHPCEMCWWQRYAACRGDRARGARLHGAGGIVALARR